MASHLRRDSFFCHSERTALLRMTKKGWSALLCAPDVRGYRHLWLTCRLQLELGDGDLLPNTFKAVIFEHVGAQSPFTRPRCGVSGDGEWDMQAQGVADGPFR